MNPHNPDCDVNDVNLEGITKPCNCGAQSSLAPAPGSAPLWYTEEELRHYLKAFRHYSDEIASELANDYARNLQSAFQKGWEMATQAAQNARTEPQPEKP